MGWTDLARVKRAIGPQVAADPYLDDVVAAANAWAPRKRFEAGYRAPDSSPEDPDVAPSPDVALGTTLYAVALYNERGATDSFASFQDLSGYTPATGSLGQINRLLGIGKGQVDTPLGAPV
jgi:hypothetical protein